MTTLHDPTTGAAFAGPAPHDGAAVRAALRRASLAQAAWGRTTMAARAVVLRAMARVLRRDVDAHALLMAREMGKPVRQGRAEIEKCAATCTFYADQGAALLADRSVAHEAHEAFVTHQPLGTILAVMPWNFPFWQVIRAAAPALMAGNAMLLKHASNVPHAALALEEAWREAGLPEGLFQALLIDGAAARRLIRSPLVQGVTLTGSTGAGRAVGKAAGDRLKPCVLELGGSDPYVVLADADLDVAVEACATSRLLNSGQSCIAAKRFIVVAAVREAFEVRLVRRLAAARLGDPRSEATDVGPMARHDLREELHDQVQRSIAKGARLLLGGTIPDGPGAFYPPTVLTDVRRGMPAWREELFGPVAAIIPVRDERAALKAANASVFGLGAAVFTRDLERGRRIARDELQAGSCAVNDFVRSDPRLPFGGIRESGFGRELAGEGIRAFTNLKSVVIA
jgi:succinate-semialdehyde dehydrogenase/glutarate-semialdehyde dehydrogenase